MSYKDKYDKIFANRIFNYTTSINSVITAKLKQYENEKNIQQVIEADKEQDEK